MNLLWILVNLAGLGLTFHHLVRYRRGGQGVPRLPLATSLAHLLFWGPLFLVTLAHPDWDYEQARQSTAHEVALHVALVHPVVSPCLQFALEPGVRQAGYHLFLRCSCCRPTHHKPEPSSRAVKCNIF